MGRNVNGRNVNHGHSKTGPIASVCIWTSFSRMKPMENAFIEAFNGRLRGECLNVHQFTLLADAQGKIETGRLP